MLEERVTQPCLDLACNACTGQLENFRPLEEGEPYFNIEKEITDKELDDLKITLKQYSMSFTS